MTNPITDKTVVFTQLQLEFLQKVFPTIVYGANSSEEAMRHYFGQQSVIELIKSRTQGMRNALQT